MGSSAVNYIAAAIIELGERCIKRGGLPEPVGPVTRIIPCGFDNNVLHARGVVIAHAQMREVSRPACLSNKRNNALSGIGGHGRHTHVNFTSATFKPIRPSCGTRFSAISSFAITLIRDTNNGASAFGLNDFAKHHLRALRSTGARRFQYEYPKRSILPPRSIKR